MNKINIFQEPPSRSEVSTEYLEKTKKMVSIVDSHNPNPHPEAIIVSNRSSVNQPTFFKNLSGSLSLPPTPYFSKTVIRDLLYTSPQRTYAHQVSINNANNPYVYPSRSGLDIQEENTHQSLPEGGVILSPREFDQPEPTEYFNRSSYSGISSPNTSTKELREGFSLMNLYEDAADEQLDEKQYLKELYLNSLKAV